MSLWRTFWAWRWAGFASWWALWLILQAVAAWMSNVRWYWILAILGLWAAGVPVSILDGRFRRRHAAEDALDAA